MNLLTRKFLSATVCTIAITVASSHAFAQAPERPPSIVEIGQVSMAEIAPTVAVSGTVYSRDELSVTAGLGGLLTAVLEPGERVKKGDVIASIDPSTLQLQRLEQEALLARAEIQVKQLENERRRQAELSTTNVVSEFQLEQTIANRDLAEADAEIIKVRIRQIDDQIRRTSTRAPFNGLVVERMHRGGEEVARGTVLARVTATDNLEIRAFVPLKYLTRVHTGDVLTVYDNSQRIQGAIRALIPTGDVRSQTFEARIEIPTAAINQFPVGSLVSVAVPIRNEKQSLAVPRDAVVLRNDAHYVMRISPDNKAERVVVELGDSKDDLIAVEGDLNVGDQVAVRGGETLSDGASVQIRG